MKFEPKHVVSMVVALSAAVVLAPVGVMAATGTLTNLVDPYDASRRARVSTGSALYVDSRPRAAAGNFNVHLEDVNSIANRKVYETVTPTRIAITDITMTVENNDTGTSNAGNVVELVQYVKESGSAPCGGAGWTRKVLRKITANRGQTVQLNFAVPLMLPDNPRRVCVVVFPTQLMGGTDTHVGVSGFVFK